MKKKNDEITLKGLLKIFAPAWWILLIVSVVLASLLGVYSAMQQDTFTSKGKYMVVKVNMSDNNAQTGLNEGEIKAMQAMVANFSEIINTENFTEKVLAILNDTTEGGESESGESLVNLTTAQLRKMMSVSISGQDTTCFYFSVTASNPEYAEAIADVAGELLVKEYREMANYAIQIAEIDSAQFPEKPDDKNVVRNAIIGFAAGLFLSLVVVFVVNRFDVIVRGRDKIEETFDIPVLGVIPRLETEIKNQM